MKKKRVKNYGIFRKPRTRAMKSLNNIFVICKLTSGWIIELKDKVNALKINKIYFSYPAQNGKPLKVARRKSKIVRLLNEKSRYDVYKESIISSVTIFEQYLAQMLRVVYFLFPKKLRVNIKGEEINKSISIDLLFEYETTKEVIKDIVEKKIISIIQSGPERYFDIICNIFSIDINELPVSEYIEIKATRDLIVHSNGVVNDMYIRKAGERARGVKGKKIPLDEEYLGKSIDCLKQLIKKIYKMLLDKYGES